MSLAVSPSPRPLSGSLEVMESRVTAGCGSWSSVTVTVATTSTMRWLGGQRAVGERVTVSCGGVRSMAKPSNWLARKGLVVNALGATSERPAPNSSRSVTKYGPSTPPRPIGSPG